MGARAAGARCQRGACRSRAWRHARCANLRAERAAALGADVDPLAGYNEGDPDNMPPLERLRLVSSCRSGLMPLLVLTQARAT